MLTVEKHPLNDCVSYDRFHAEADVPAKSAAPVDSFRASVAAPSLFSSRISVFGREAESFSPALLTSAGDFSQQACLFHP
ncbi:hypothetical protein [Noviherbaspirillum sp.]|uniref:hypothetical protein n=1 Tax=Noviherbaspirillum sp. TaxID=1926288 RepID=UPI002FE2C657